MRQSGLWAQIAFGTSFVLFVLLFLGLGLFGAGWRTEWGTGLAIIALYVVLSQPWRSSNPETQDSIYFLGFLMTLSYLVIGLHRADTGVFDVWIRSFLSELGVALGFSIIGLGLRQLVTLAGDPDVQRTSSIPPVEFSESSARRIAELFSEALRPVSERFEESARAGIEVLKDGHEKLHQSLDLLQEDATKAADSLRKASSDISSSANEASAEARKAIAKANKAITEQIDASSRISESLGRHLQDLEATVAALVDQVETIGGNVEDAARNAQESLRSMATRLAESEKLIATSVTLTATTWQEQLDAARDDLAQFNATWRREKVAGLDDLRSLTEELRTMADAVQTSVEAIPSPADRIEGLWQTLSDGEQKIAAASGEMANALGSLEAEVETLTKRVDRTGRSLETGSEDVRQALADEAAEINRIIGELYRLLESKINRIGRE